MESKTIRFLRRGEPVSLANVPPDRTLLEVLREDLACTGTKEGCGEGDCGACTVVLAEPRPEDEGEGLRFRAINSCIRLAHSVDGMALWTAEDLAAEDGALHPAQEALVQCHGSQCGFCTPGFVMSLFGMYQKYIAPTLPTACGSLPPEGALAPRGGPSALACQGRTITRELAQAELSGNLCRCTGYRPILDAAQAMADLPLAPALRVDEARIAAQLRELNAAKSADQGAYLAPTSLAELLAARAAHPQAQIVAGCTDVGLWVTKMHKQFDQVLDVTRAAELRRVEHYPHHIAIGAAVTLSDAFAALVAERPGLKTFAERFAGLPVRNSGTLGGNVANGSPIGDAMPLLIALGANVVLMSARGHRELPLEQLYTGYRQNVIAPDELLAWIKVPRPVTGEPSAAPGRPKQASAPSGGSAAHAVASVGAEFLRAYKVSKRYDDDISAVCLVIRLELDGDLVQRASIGAGGVAATPVRATQAEAALNGQPWTREAAQQAGAALRAQFQPISDMRASAAYRSELLGNLMQRFWLESQGLTAINLENFVLEEAA